MTCEEIPATMFSRQGNASACGDSDFFQSMKIDAEECHNKEEDALLALDIGDLFLQSNDNEDDVIAFCGTEHDEGAVGATCQTRKLSHHQTLLACDDGDSMLPYNEEQEIIL